MTTPLFLLRCTEIGISIVDLDFLTIGLVIDMWTERANDGVKYKRLASQEDFDNSSYGLKEQPFLDIIYSTKKRLFLNKF